MCTYVGTYLILYSTWSNCNHEKISSNFRRAAASQRARPSCGRARPRRRPPPTVAMGSAKKKARQRSSFGSPLPNAASGSGRRNRRASPPRSQACARPSDEAAASSKLRAYLPVASKHCLLSLTPTPRALCRPHLLPTPTHHALSLSLSLPLSLSPADDSRPFRRPPRPCRRRPPRAPTCIPLEGRVQAPIYSPPTRHTPFFLCGTGIMFPGLEAQRRQRPLWYQATFGAWLLFSMSTLIALRYIYRFSQPILPQIPHTLFSQGE